MTGGVLDTAAKGQSGRLPGRLTLGSATGSAVELFPEDVRVSGVPGGLARHVGHNPPECMPVAVDRDDDARFRVADVPDRSVAVLNGRPVVPQHVASGTAGGDGHAVFPAGVPRGSGEVVAEPIPLRLGQVLDETKDAGAAVDQDAAQLLIGQPVGFLQRAVPGERQERQGCVELARVDAWYGLSLSLRHAATVAPATSSDPTICTAIAALAVFTVGTQAPPQAKQTGLVHNPQTK